MGGQVLVWFISECGTAQLNLSLFFLFSCATADIVIDVDGLDNILPSWSSSTSTAMTMIFRPIRGLENLTRQKDRHIERNHDIMTTYALREEAVKIVVKKVATIVLASKLPNVDQLKCRVAFNWLNFIIRRSSYWAIMKIWHWFWVTTRGFTGSSQIHNLNNCENIKSQDIVNWFIYPNIIIVNITTQSVR